MHFPLFHSTFPGIWPCNKRLMSPYFVAKLPPSFDPGSWSKFCSVTLFGLASSAFSLYVPWIIEQESSYFVAGLPPLCFLCLLTPHSLDGDELAVVDLPVLVFVQHVDDSLQLEVRQTHVRPPQALCELLHAHLHGIIKIDLITVSNAILEGRLKWLEITAFVWKFDVKYF